MDLQSLALNQYRIEIAGVSFLLSTDHLLGESENFQGFMRPMNEEVECCCKVSCVFETMPEEIGDLDGVVLGRDHDSTVYRLPNGEVRRYYSFGPENDYAYSHYVSKGIESEIVYFKDRFQNDVNAVFHLSGWEQMLLCHDRMILHSSCIDTMYGGILFSGVSGIGKSTQAELWRRHRGARLINGDRTILHRDEQWRGYGSPFAGSSRCYVDDSVPVRAIVMLEQGPENVVKRLPIQEAFRKIYEGVTVYTWDREYMERVLNLVTRLMEEIPVYQLTCTPDLGAVEALERVLRKEDGDE